MCYILYLFFVRKTTSFLLIVGGGQKKRPLFKNFTSSIFFFLIRGKTNMSSAEECNSNESGWTKYLGSPSQDEGNYSSGVYDDVDECNYYYHRHDLVSRKGGKNKDSDDNDSVASDASSGPSHHEAFIARGINGGGCSKLRAPEQDQGHYYGKRQPLGERACSEVKGKAVKEPGSDHKPKKGTSLKQKRARGAYVIGFPGVVCAFILAIYVHRTKDITFGV